MLLIYIITGIGLFVRSQVFIIPFPYFPERGLGSLRLFVFLFTLGLFISFFGDRTQLSHGGKATRRKQFAFIWLCALKSRRVKLIIWVISELYVGFALALIKFATCKFITITSCLLFIIKIGHYLRSLQKQKYCKTISRNWCIVSW